LVDTYLEKHGNVCPTDFLKGDMAEIRQRYRAIVGRKMAAPRINLVE